MRRAAAGFTLVELLVVLLIIALSAWMVLPSIQAGAQQREVRHVVQRFVSAVRTASSRAIHDRRTTGLAVWLDGGAFGLQDGKTRVELPAYATFGDVAGGTYDPDDDKVVFQFYPTGGSSGGAVEIAFETRNARQSYLLRINPLLSSVSIEEGQ